MKQPLHFSFFPAGDENIASSRIRVFSTIRVFKQRGIPFSIGDPRDATVLYIQKKVTPALLRQARHGKWKGKTIIYEIDDFGEAMTYWVPLKLFEKIVRLADIIVTATPEEAELLASMYNVKGATILPPCIDYYPDQPVRLPLDSTVPFRILWFGSSGNFHMVKKYLQTLRTVPDVQVVVCMDPGGQALISGDNFEFVPWELSTFPSVLQSCQMTCLTHDETYIGRVKTNNKMATSITWGVPAAVTRTPDYLRTAQEAGIEYAVFSDEEQLKGVVERLRPPEARQQYLDAAQPVIWANQSPSVIADRILKLPEQSKYANRFQRLMIIIASYL